MSAAAPSPEPVGGGVDTVPRHLAIIMDGNGRWAARRHLPRIAGHRAGMDAVRRTIRAAAALGIGTLTLYAFSSENWRRPLAEVSDLMGLLRHYLRRELAEFDREGARLRLIGDWRRFEPDLVRDLEEACARTAANDRIEVVIALSYGARDELTRAARALAEDAVAGRIAADAIDEDALERRLDTRDLPPLDLLIRTSGETRLSNFLLWQAAYAELLFVETLWPDFDAATLETAVRDYAQRDRRFGGR